MCTSNSTVVVRRRTRVTAWETTAASSTGSTDGEAGASRASSTRSPISCGHLADLRLYVVQQLLARGGRERRRAVGLGEQVEVGPQRGQRRAQLVAGVGDELALACLRGGERGQHRVERDREPGHLVGALDGDGLESLGAGDVLDGRGQPAHRPQPVAGHRPARQPRRDHPGQAEEQHHQAEAVEHLVGGLQRLGEDQRLAALRVHRDHAVPLPVDAHGPRRPVVLAQRDPELGGGDGGCRALAATADGLLVGVEEHDLDVGGAQHPGRDLLAGQSVEGVGVGGQDGPAVQRGVQGVHRLHPHRGVRRERHRGHRDAHGHRGEQGDAAGQRLPVSQRDPTEAPALRVVEAGAHDPSRSTYPTPRTVWIRRASSSASVLRRRYPT